ncbi:MAG: hypothetical protein CVT88_07120 [Candidatus Altiarchaeales archaeon HGW-Altiarchaeales-1]|nr:MAG: hypothetical protein CVT88_07120 [Candidatus Altiarchaeales archaeon HGW-Altiarchaeales-1]
MKTKNSKTGKNKNLISKIFVFLVVLFISNLMIGSVIAKDDPGCKLSAIAAGWYCAYDGNTCKSKGNICELQGTSTVNYWCKCVKKSSTGTEGCAAVYVDDKTCYVSAPQDIQYVIPDTDIIIWTTHVTLPLCLGGGTIDSNTSQVEFNLSFKNNISEIVPFTITGYRATWQSVDIQGISTGVNYETLNSNYNSSGFFNRTTGQIISSFSTIITNDIYTTENPMIARGYIIGTINCTNNITTIQYDGTLEFPYDETIPSSDDCEKKIEEIKHKELLTVYYLPLRDAVDKAYILADYNFNDNAAGFIGTIEVTNTNDYPVTIIIDPSNLEGYVVVSEQNRTIDKITGPLVNVSDKGITYKPAINVTLGPHGSPNDTVKLGIVGHCIGPYDITPGSGNLPVISPVEVTPIDPRFNTTKDIVEFTNNITYPEDFTNIEKGVAGSIIHLAITNQSVTPEQFLSIYPDVNITDKIIPFVNETLNEKGISTEGVPLLTETGVKKEPAPVTVPEKPTEEFPLISIIIALLGVGLTTLGLIKKNKALIVIGIVLLGVSAMQYSMSPMPFYR